MSTDIEQVSTALVEFDKVAAGLAILEKNYAGVVYDVETAQGMEFAKEARRTIRAPRHQIEHIRKGAKAPLIAIGKKLDDEAKRITAALLKIEEPIDEQIKNEEGRKERERLAAEAAETARIAGIQLRIDSIRTLPVTTNGKTAEQIGVILQQAKTMSVGADFAEFTEAAQTALSASVASLAGLYQMAIDREAEQARIIAERAELAKLRSEQEARDKAERERLAEEGRAAREAAEAEQRRQQAELTAQRAALAEQERIAREAQQAEAARLAEEGRKVAAERAALEARQAAAAEAAKPKPKDVRPSDREIIEAVAEAFATSTDTASFWLREMKWVKAA